MQRLHADDLAGYLLREQPARWTHLKLPAINDADRLIQLGAGRVHTWKKGELLHPEREPQSVLDDLRVEQGSLTFAAAMASGSDAG